MFEIVEHYVTDHGGMGAFLALMVLKVGEMIWTYLRNRDHNIKTLQCAVEKQTAVLNALRSDLKKFKVDLNRAFYGLKHLSGDDWPELSEKMREKFKHEGDLNGS